MMKKGQLDKTCDVCLPPDWFDGETKFDIVFDELHGKVL